MKKTLFVLLALFLLLPVTAGAWTLPVPSGLTTGDRLYASDGNTVKNFTVSTASYDNNAAISVAGGYLVLATANVATTEVTISESGAVTGQTLVIINVSASNSLSIKESAGVNDQAGDITLGPLDAVSYIYRGTSWVQTGLSNN